MVSDYTIGLRNCTRAVFCNLAKSVHPFWYESKTPLVPVHQYSTNLPILIAPLSRVARTKAAPSSDLTGMNELEGSVLLEADDYRRLFNEVKALKTALLKLKRELQVDVSQIIWYLV